MSRGIKHSYFNKVMKFCFSLFFLNQAPWYFMEKYNIMKTKNIGNKKDQITIGIYRTEENSSTENTASDYLQTGNCGKVTIDNIRRSLSTFFSWLEEEDYIIKSSMKKIHKVKTAIMVKDTIPDEKVEILRDNCNNLRDRAMIDFLLSTGVRVGEWLDRTLRI